LQDTKRQAKPFSRNAWPHNAHHCLQSHSSYETSKAAERESIIMSYLPFLCHRWNRRPAGALYWSQYFIMAGVFGCRIQYGQHTFWFCKMILNNWFSFHSVLYYFLLSRLSFIWKQPTGRREISWPAREHYWSSGDRTRLVAMFRMLFTDSK